MARKPVRVEPAVEPVAPAAPPAFTNTTAHTTIHLGDGRKVAPGETIAVTPELLARLTA